LQVLVPASPKSRQSFVSSGALQRLQGLTGREDRVGAAAEKLNKMFPGEVVSYYR
jgi:hypothetical protein